MLMHEADVPVLEDGGNSDFRFYPKGRGTVYEPVKVDQALKDGEKVRLGATELTVHHHPGHTKGATSFTFTVRDGGRDYRIGIINMNGINEGVLLLKSPGYPRIVEEYAQTFAKQKQISLDVFLSSHAGQFRLHEKYKARRSVTIQTGSSIRRDTAPPWNARSRTIWSSCRRSAQCTRPRDRRALFADHLHYHFAASRARVELEQHRSAARCRARSHRQRKEQ